MLYAHLSETQSTLKYHLITVKPSFTVKTIDCVHQTGLTGRKLERLGTSLTRSTITMTTVLLSVAVSKMWVILHHTWSENQLTVLLWYITISVNIRCYEVCHWWQFYLTATQCTNGCHIQHRLIATVQNTHIPFFLANGLKMVPSLTPMTPRFRDRHSSNGMSCNKTE